MTEIEVGASLKWATAKAKQVSQRGNGDLNQGRERKMERGGDFADAPPSEKQFNRALGSARALNLVRSGPYRH